MTTTRRLRLPRSGPSTQEPISQDSHATRDLIQILLDLEVRILSGELTVLEAQRELEKHLEQT